jgi:hypothetical protein
MARRDEFGYTKVTMNIGDWNMATTATVAVPHGLSATEYKTIKNMSAIIRDDADTNYFNLSATTTLSLDINGSTSLADATNIYLVRRAGGGSFATTDYDSTSYNRGFITFEYIAN